MKIACWSGPRNISTALMRSWSSRNDTYISDEPLYACYLKENKINHPMYEEIISSYETNYLKIIETLQGQIPNQYKIWYQKHMAHHLQELESLEWIESFHNCFLIRDPKYVINSYIKKNKLESMKELGYYQQYKILEYLKNKRGNFIVIDTQKFLNKPDLYLMQWCKKLNIRYKKNMLKWEKKIYPYDGIWAKHWYDNVVNSNTFFNKKNNPQEIPNKYYKIYEESKFYYDKIKKYELSLDYE
tara:strand:- start:2098 stop:2826 length:729 start_codon:yes stop_codon:yes gene_type:complete